MKEITLNKLINIILLLINLISQNMFKKIYWKEQII